MISLNKAQRWVKEAVDDVKEKLPFQMKGLTSLAVCSANCSEENSRYSISEASEKQSSISPVDKRIIPLLRLSFKSSLAFWRSDSFTRERSFSKLALSYSL